MTEVEAEWSPKFRGRFERALGRARAELPRSIRGRSRVEERLMAAAIALRRLAAREDLPADFAERAWEAERAAALAAATREITQLERRLPRRGKELRYDLSSLGLAHRRRAHLRTLLGPGDLGDFEERQANWERRRQQAAHELDAEVRQVDQALGELPRWGGAQVRHERVRLRRRKNNLEAEERRPVAWHFPQSPSEQRELKGVGRQLEHDRQVASRRPSSPEDYARFVAEW